MTPRIPLLPVVLIVLSIAATVHAEEAESPEDREFEATVARAVELYEAQQYDQAIEAFQRAYEMRPQPELIYNIARIYERSVRQQEAVEAYERFLSLPNTTADLRSRAANSLAALRAEIAARERAERAGQNTGTNDGATTGTGTGETPPPPPPPPRRRTPATVIAGWVLVGVGGAALAAGVVMGGLALAEQTATEEAGNLADQNLHLDRGETYALSADVLFGAGGAMAVAGIILLVVNAVRNRRDDDETSDPNPYDTGNSVSLSPTALFGGGFGLNLAGRF